MLYFPTWQTETSAGAPAGVIFIDFRWSLTTTLAEYSFPFLFPTSQTESPGVLARPNLSGEISHNHR